MSDFDLPIDLIRVANRLKRIAQVDDGMTPEAHDLPQDSSQELGVGPFSIRIADDTLFDSLEENAEQTMDLEQLTRVTCNSAKDCSNIVQDFCNVYNFQPNQFQILDGKHNVCVTGEQLPNNLSGF